MLIAIPKPFLGKEIKPQMGCKSRVGGSWPGKVLSTTGLTNLPPIRINIVVGHFPY